MFDSPVFDTVKLALFDQSGPLLPFDFLYNMVRKVTSIEENRVSVKNAETRSTGLSGFLGHVPEPEEGQCQSRDGRRPWPPSQIR